MSTRLDTCMEALRSLARSSELEAKQAADGRAKNSRFSYVTSGCSLVTWLRSRKSFPNVELSRYDRTVLSGQN
jgi:hypothetical protein